MATTPPLRVLVVDDALELRVLLRLHLERDGRFEVVGEAPDGEQAITVAASLAPDAIVLDLAMPVMDGLTALPRLRHAHPHAAIAVLTGFTTGGLAGRTAADADGLVVKGGDLDELADVLLAGRARRSVDGASTARWPAA